jgi:uncharacterized membrane protein
MRIEAIHNAFTVGLAVEVIIVNIAILICDFIGIVVLMTTVGKGVYNYFHKDRHVKLSLAQGIALALEFKLAGEVLRTVTVREFNELVILGTIIALRGAITLLIHWEIKVEKAEQAADIKPTDTEPM